MQIVLIYKIFVTPYEWKGGRKGGGRLNGAYNIKRGRKRNGRKERDKRDEKQELEEEEEGSNEELN